jgi:hypothetical protein
MSRYKVLNPHSEFCCLNTQSKNSKLSSSDRQDRSGVLSIRIMKKRNAAPSSTPFGNSANIVAFHDICNSNCPGIAQCVEPGENQRGLRLL